MSKMTLFERLFAQAHAEANAAYDAAETPEEAYDAFRARMDRFAREYPKRCHPLRYATRLLAEGAPQQWVEYLGADFVTYQDDAVDLAMFLAGEAAKQPLSFYQEPDGILYFRFLRGVQDGRYGHTVKDIQFAAEIVLGGLV
jgi:hypothetical protein